MRKLLLAGAAVLPLLFGAPAHADLPVIDVSAIARLLQQLGIENEQLTQLLITVKEIEDVYVEATQIYNSLSELVGADQWAPGLRAERNPLPFTAREHPGWVSGANDPSSLPFGSYYMGANTIGGDITVYQDGSFVGGEFVKAIRSIATIQSIASNNILSIENRILALGDLFERLGSIGTLQETDSLSARLHSEANYAHSQQVQSQNLRAAADQQLAVLTYNQRQYEWQDEKNGVKTACGALAAGPSAFSLAECN